MIKEQEQKVLLNATVQMLKDSAPKDSPFSENFDISTLDVWGKEKLEYGTQALEILDYAHDNTQENMPWLKGIHLSPSQFTRLLQLVENMNEAINNMAKFEHCFHANAKLNETAMNNFMGNMLGGLLSMKLEKNKT